MLTEGADASLTVDGYTVTSSSNTVTGVIKGVTLKLVAADSDNTITLDVSRDTSVLSDQVSTLVDKLNSALSYIKSQNTYNESDDTANVLMGNATLSSIRSNIADTLLESVSGNSTYTTAASIGISYGSDGTLSFDSSTFAAALAENPDEVINVVKSLSSSLYTSLDAYVDPTTGTLTKTEDSINERISEVEEQLEAAEARCEKQNEILEEQFSKLMTLISSTSTISSYLTYQIDALNSSSD